MQSFLGTLFILARMVYRTMYHIPIFSQTTIMGAVTNLPLRLPPFYAFIPKNFMVIYKEKGITNGERHYFSIPINFSCVDKI
jgi:hypothetical protein